MFDLSHLNDYEFELLCKDIMQIKLGVELYTFPRGADQGVDICDKSKKIVIQAKHYSQSTYSQLKTALKKELVKLEKFKPKHYYIITSQTLTLSNKQELQRLFKSYIPDISYIFAKNEIDAFLSEDKHKDIVKKNYKLWLSSTNVLTLITQQNILIDCTELEDSIHQKIPLYVQTQAYFESRKKLDDNNIVLIVGSPGVGKTITSHMLLIDYIEKKYSVRYSTNNNLSDLKKSLFLDIDKKEIILLDDFLGQHYLKIREEQPNELKTIISFIEKSPYKKLILNSRITILNEAIQKNICFEKLIENKESQKYTIDLDKMPMLDKAFILYNHIYFNQLPDEYFSSIKQDKKYLEIIRHPNYNPRIIEFITNKKNYSTVNSKSYLAYIFDKLKNPKAVWRDEFDNRLSELDRILVNTLYSLTDTVINEKVLRKAFNQRISSRRDNTVNNYETTIVRLNDSIIKIIAGNNVNRASVHNPSINDYLSHSIKNNVNEQKDIIRNSCFIEQILRVVTSESNDEVINLMKEKQLRLLPSIHTGYSADYYYLKLVADYHIKLKELRDDIVLAIHQAHPIPHFYLRFTYYENSEYASLMIKLLESDLCHFYSLEEVFSNQHLLKQILTNFPVYRVDEAIKAYRMKIYSHLDESKKELLDGVFIDAFITKLESDIIQKVSDELGSLLESNFSNGSSMGELQSYLTVESPQLISEEIEKGIEFIQELVDIDLNTKIDLSGIRNQIDLNEIANYFLSSLEVENEDDVDQNDNKTKQLYENLNEQLNTINELFER